MNYNKLQLGGYLITDLRPFTSATSSGVTGRIRVVETRGQDKVELVHDFRATGKVAESMLTMGVENGVGLFIEGPLERHEWRDRSTGERKHRDLLTVKLWRYTDDKDMDNAMSRCPVIPTPEKID